MRNRSLVAGAQLGCTLALVGCSGATFDVGALEARHPALAHYRGQRLADAAPYFSPEGEGLALFLCRFETDAPIPVVLPDDASAAETEIFRRALDAWAGAVDGVAFAVVARTDAGESRRIEIDFVDDPMHRAPLPGGDTIADCAVPERADSDAPIAAALAYASIQLHRTRRDGLGRDVPLSSVELLGATVHELGHALGYPGHVRSADAVMAAHAQIDAARRWGRWLELGRPLSSPSLSALYALPSGARVGFLPLTDEQRAPFDALRRAAGARGLRGPYARVGDRDARLFWRAPDGRSVVLEFRDFGRALSDPAAFVARPNAAARVLLEWESAADPD